VIRKATAADAAFLYELYMSPANNPYLLYEYMDRDGFKPILDELLSKGHLYIFEYEESAAGMCKLVPMTHRNSHVIYLGGVAIAPSYTGKGLGEKMLREVVQLCNEQNYKRIELSVATMNLKAISLYERLGFVQEGVLRKLTWLKKEDKFLDEVMMSLLL
jgi:L-phenylalanine/L-methionine N-acetyltransferase